MEKNEIITREKLKTYFKTGKYPTESQFAELIDSLKLKNDVLTNKEIVTISNSLASLDNAYIIYSAYDVGDKEFPIVVSSKDEEDQLFTIKNTRSQQQKRYFHGNTPYSIKAKEFTAEGLAEHEYYYLYSLIDSSYGTIRLFGNNLPLPHGFELGKVNKEFYMQLSKQRFDRKINNLHTVFTFFNRTEVPIQYSLYGDYWCNPYISEDLITDHYDLSDYLGCYYRADLTEISKSIKCRIYNADNNTLLMTARLVAGQKNQNVWAEGTITAVRNVRIECDYES